MNLDPEHLKDLKSWLESDVIDDPEDLFDEINVIVELIDFYLSFNNWIEYGGEEE